MNVEVETRPTSVRVGWTTYSIEWVDEDTWLKEHDDNKDDAGLCYNLQLRILIRVHPDAHEHLLMECLVHEILHALWYVSGLTIRDVMPIDADDAEEEVVAHLSPSLSAVLRDNHALVEYLTRVD